MTIEEVYMYWLTASSTQPYCLQHITVNSNKDSEEQQKINMATKIKY
jgi:hypothetical protein